MHSLSRKNIEYFEQRQRLISLPGLLFVIAVHAALFYFLWHQRLVPHPEQAMTLFAELITPPAPVTPPKASPEPAPVKLQPAKKPVVKPKQEQLAAKSPAPAEKKQTEPAPEPPKPAEQVRESAPAASPKPAPTAPVALSSELAVSCPKLTPPEYPAISRRMGEEGKLILRVELDENGHIDNAKVLNSSGYERLDAAALSAVKSWQCNPSLRDGQPVRAVALQPFNFVLQGN